MAYLLVNLRDGDNKICEIIMGQALSLRKQTVQLKLLLPRHKRQRIGWLEGRNRLEMEVKQGTIQARPP